MTFPGAAIAETWDRLPLLSHVDDFFAAHPRRQGIVTGLSVGQVHITFETTRWSDLRRAFGPLRLRQQGDGDEMAGREFIDGVTVVAGTSWPLKQCPQVDPGPGPIALDNGIWIGVSKASLLKRLGRPTAATGTSMTYDYSIPLHDRRLGEGVAQGRISFEIKAHHVLRFTASKDTVD
jgi:hypothetical protein